MRRRFSFFLLLTALFTALCIADTDAFTKSSSAEPVVSWVFDIKMDDTETPRGRVFLDVDGRKVLIRPAVVGDYRVLDRADYKSAGVPATAITACSGWWAGQGEDLYVIRRKKQLIVYIRYLDEGASVPSYRRLKTIQLK